MTTIKPYESYFHDGALIGVKHQGESLLLEMISAEVDREDIHEPIVVSKIDCIKGAIHLERVTSISIDGNPFCGVFQMEGELGGIFDLEISDKLLQIQLEWENYSVKDFPDNFHTIIFEADHIWWENLPDMLTPFD